MTLHEKGFKGDRDRARLLYSYKQMIKVLRTPSDERITPAQFAHMTNAHIFRACKDIYNNAPLAKANKLAKILGIEPINKRKKLGIIERFIKAVFHV